MILMPQIFDVTANENARYKRNELELNIELLIFHLNIVKECIVLYNHQCFMVDMSCCGDQ